MLSYHLTNKFYYIHAFPYYLLPSHCFTFPNSPFLSAHRPRPWAWIVEKERSWHQSANLAILLIAFFLLDSASGVGQKYEGFMGFNKAGLEFGVRRGAAQGLRVIQSMGGALMCF